MAKLADARDLKSYITQSHISSQLTAYKTFIDIIASPDILTQLFHTFAFLKECGGTSAMAEQYTILGGKVHVYKRPNSSHWQCSSYFAGKNRRTSTKEDSLSKAKEIAEDWYLQLRGKLRSGEIKTEKTFREASELFLREYDIITQGQRSKVYVEGQQRRSQGHLVPFFGPWAFRKLPPARSRTTAFIATKKRGQARQTAGPQHHASGDRGSSANPENSHPPRMARPSSRSLRAVQIIPENLAPGVVLSRGIQETLRGHKKTRA